MKYTIKSVSGYVFGTKQLQAWAGLGLYNPEVGFVTFDGKKPWTPAGGRKALQELLITGFVGENQHIKPNPNFKLVKNQLVRV